MNQYHTIAECGFVGVRNPAQMWQIYKLPEDLTGKTLLGIGAFTGGFTVEACKRGACVTAMDKFGPENPFITSNGAFFSRCPSRIVLESVREMTKHDFVIVDHDIQVPYVGKFDIVLYLQVTYHLFNPIAGLINALQCTKANGLFVLESLVSRGNDVPALYWLGREESTDYWFPSMNLLETLFDTLGCTVLSKWHDSNQRACYQVLVPENLRYDNYGCVARSVRSGLAYGYA